MGPTRKVAVEHDDPEDVVDPKGGLVLTAEALRHRLASLQDFVSITTDAAALLAQEGIMSQICGGTGSTA